MKSKNSRPEKDDDASIPHMHAGWSMSSEVFTPEDTPLAETSPSPAPESVPPDEKPAEQSPETSQQDNLIFSDEDLAQQESVQTTPPPPPPPVDEEPVVEDSGNTRERGLRTLWTVGAVLSILLNCILVIILIVLGNQLFTLKKMVGIDLIGGLYANFVKMDQASIKTTITVSDQIPINFNLPISQDTTVTLREPTYINGARVTLNTGGLSINNAPADIILPAGTTLPIHLEMTVPVQQSVPVTLNVPVDIPLSQTELHEPFTGLQQVISPFFWLMKPDWNSCKDVPILRSLGPVCTLIFKDPK